MPSKQGASKLNHMYLLDLSRFIAAVAVIFFHYRHFFYVGGLKPTLFNAEIQPFYEYFHLFYEYGFYAVQYFWVLSGFIFHYTYFYRLRRNEIGFGRYFWSRFTRLYPLHLFTLILVAVLSLIFYQENGYYFVYQFNDAKHFFLQFFMLSNWGAESGDSFNGPIWSVSVEIFAYIVFYLVSIKCRLNKFLVTSCIALCSIALFKLTGSNLFYGVFCFYIGGFTFFVYEVIVTKYELDRSFLLKLIIVIAIPLLLFAYAISNYSISKNFFILSLLMIFSCAVLILCLIQNLFPNIASSSKPLGDISYSIYLIHFPIQLFLMYAMQPFLNLTSPLFFIAYSVVTLFASIILFNKLELPSKQALRARYKQFKKSSA